MKSNLDKFFKTNTQQEKEGIWMMLDDVTQFLVGRYGGQNAEKIRKLLALKEKPYAHQIQRKALPIATEYKITTEVFVESCLYGWKGVIGEDGQEIPFSRENAYALFKRLPDLRDALIKYAVDQSNFAEAEEAKEALGNS